MISWPEGYRPVGALPEAFGTRACRALRNADGLAVLLVAAHPQAAPSAEAEAAWRSAKPEAGLCPWVDRGEAEGTAYWILTDEGGPLLADLPAGEWSSWAEAWLGQWADQPAGGPPWTAFDPRRILATSRGPRSFDVIHRPAVPGNGGPLPLSDADLQIAAPELTGRTSWLPGAGSGLYSWAAAVSRSAGGRWPLEEGDRLAMVHGLLSRESRLPELPSDPGLRSILAQLLAKEPRRRYGSPAGLQWDLEHRTSPEWTGPGTRDWNPAGTEPSGLYGRQEAVETLRSAVAAVEGGAFRLVLLTGEGGAGKSRLAAEASREADLRGLLRVSGKFEAGEGRFTTGGLVQALAGWTSRLEAGPPSERQRWFDLVRTDLGKASATVAGILPDLAVLEPRNPEPGPAEPDQSDRKFVAAVAGLFRLAAAQRPLLLLIEDLQWADDTSVQVLEELASRAPAGLLLLLTGRPSEATDRFGDRKATEVVAVGPLEPAAVEALAAEAIGVEGPARSDLARTLLRLCDGTPYHLRLLLREAGRRQSVVYFPAQDRWVFRPETLGDLPPHGMTDVLVRRMAELGPGAQECLARAGLAGTEFTWAEAGADETLVRWLTEAGLWTSAGPERLRFTHDRNRELALGFAEGSRASRAHLLLGRERLARWRQDPTADPAAVAVHLNQVSDALTGGEEADRLRVNLAAAAGLRIRGDRPSALVFYRQALAEATQAPWQDYRDAADTAYAERQRAQGDLWSDEAALRAPQALDRALIRERQQAYLFFLGDPDASVSAGLRGLRELGISLSSEPRTPALALELAGVEAALAGRSPSALAGLPENRDPSSRAALLLLAGFVPPAFLSSRLNLFGVAVLKGTLLTLRTGLCAESAPAFTGYAVLMAALGRRRRAAEFGRLAVDLNRRFDDPVWRSMVLTLTGLFGLGWTEPWDRLGPWFADARAAALESGDVVYLSFAQLFETLWNPRDDLPVRLRRTEEAIAAIRRNRYPGTLVSALFLRGGLRLLADPSEGGLDFSSPDFDPERGLAEVAALHSDSGLAVCHTTVLATSFLRGDLVQARRAADRALAHRGAVAGSLYEEELLLYHGLLAAEEGRQGLRGARRKLAAEVRKAAAWARDSRTFAFHSSLLAGEADDLAGRLPAAQAGFLAAVDAADAAGTAAHQALARERAGRYFRRRGMEGLAQLYLSEASDRWTRYGALALSARLAREGAGSRAVPAVRPTEESFDVDSLGLVRAIGAVAASPRLEDLVRTITRLMLETSGADRVVLLVPEEGGWRVRGEAGITEQEAGRLLIDRNDLPRSVLRRTSTDLQTVVWESIAESERRREPVLAARGVKALMCVPLAVNRELRALVYLENRSAEGVLTRQRIQSLERLSGTLAVSLENARLFDQLREAKDELELRVEARTRELRDSERRAVQQEKMASLGVLTAGVAHELKNPLNLTTNFAEASLDLLREAEELWSPHVDRLGPEGAAAWQTLRTDLAANLKTVVDQGLRGTGIIRTMLLHSRRDSGDPTDEALAPLVQESVILAYRELSGSREGFTSRVDESYHPGVGTLKMVRANLGRVFLNLLTNAFQAVDDRRRTEPGFEPLVRVAVAPAGPSVKIIVEDNGPGIPAGDVAKIFEPFYTTKPAGEGTGLGLSISYDIVVREFGGTLEVESQPGGPTRFIVLLPRST